MIDAHVHFWKFDPVKDAWITNEMQVIQKDFLPKDILPLLEENTVSGLVAVQADQSEKETSFLVNLARENSFIKGVVGWVDLRDPSLEQKLSEYSKQPLIKGFRHIVQAEPPGFLKEKNFLKGIQILQRFGFTYDVLIYHHQINEAIEFVNQFPQQKFIIDHCAKPSITTREINNWKKGMEILAQSPNIYCKISGLITEASWNSWTAADLYPYLDVIFEYFGTSRTVFGSDWPVMLLSGKYSQWKNVMEAYVQKFSAGEREKFFSQNAIDFYRLEA